MVSPDGAELAELQRRFAAALLDASAPIPEDLSGRDGRERQAGSRFTATM